MRSPPHTNTHTCAHCVHRSRLRVAMLPLPFDSVYESTSRECASSRGQTHQAHRTLAAKKLASITQTHTRIYILLHMHLLTSAAGPTHVHQYHIKHTQHTAAMTTPTVVVAVSRRRPSSQLYRETRARSFAPARVASRKQLCESGVRCCCCWRCR